MEGLQLKTRGCRRCFKGVSKCMEQAVLSAAIKIDGKQTYLRHASATAQEAALAYCPRGRRDNPESRNRTEDAPRMPSRTRRRPRRRSCRTPK